jgi:hypothetical protein
MPRLWTLATAAMAGALAVAGYLWRSPQRSSTATNAVPNSSAATHTSASATSVQTVRIDLDLQNAGSKNGITRPLVLPRRRLHPAIVLPAEFATAECQLEIRGADGLSHATTSGTAAVHESAAILRTTLDLAACRQAPTTSRSATKAGSGNSRST